MVAIYICHSIVNTSNSQDTSTPITPTIPSTSTQIIPQEMGPSLGK